MRGIRSDGPRRLQEELRRDARSDEVPLGAKPLRLVGARPQPGAADVPLAAGRSRSARPLDVGARLMKGPRGPLACVMGDTDLLRPLGLAGIPCAVVTKPGAPARFSRFARVVLPWRDAWEHADELVDILTAFAASQPEAPVLFYQEDRELLLVSRYRDVLGRRFRFVVADASLVEDLVDKSRFQALASRLELPVPRARRFDPTDRSPPSELGLQFPLVIKPLTRRTDRWTPVGGAGKARCVAAPAAFAELVPRLAAAGEPLIAQELVPGPESAIESYHVYVDER